ncbi:hypothetical protein M8J76_004869 [Diaphorina citri]|nr:hypothetical protein M8J76_004869 [Diaphorina citri]
MTKVDRGCDGILSDRCIVRLLVVCVIQGLLWSSFSVFLLAIQTCALRFDSLEVRNISSLTDKFTFVRNLIYIAYLSGNCNCRQDDMVSLKNATSERTYNLLFFHGFLNALWIPICVLLIVAILGRVRGCMVSTFFYTPWLIVTLLVVSFDLIAASFYLPDLDHTRNLQDFLTYIRFKESTTEDSIPKRFTWDQYTPYVPLFFIVFFTKAIVLTLFNIVTFLQVLGLSLRICRERRFIPSNGVLVDGYDDIYAPIVDREVENIPLQSFLTPHSKLKGRQYQNDLGYNSMSRFKPGKDTQPNGYPAGDNNQVHIYLDLLAYQTPEYQHIYEDIWRDIKKEKLAYSGGKGDKLFLNGGNTPSSPVYDYLGRPLLEYMTASTPGPPLYEDVDNKLLSSLIHIETPRPVMAPCKPRMYNGVKFSDTPPALPASLKPSKKISNCYEEISVYYNHNYVPGPGDCDQRHHSIEETNSEGRKSGDELRKSAKDCGDKFTNGVKDCSDNFSSGVKDCSSDSKCDKGVKEVTRGVEAVVDHKSSAKNGNSAKPCSSEKGSCSPSKFKSKCSRPNPPDLSTLPTCQSGKNTNGSRTSEDGTQNSAYKEDSKECNQNSKDNCDQTSDQNGNHTTEEIAIVTSPQSERISVQCGKTEVVTKPQRKRRIGLAPLIIKPILPPMDVTADQNRDIDINQVAKL